MRLAELMMDSRRRRAEGQNMDTADVGEGRVAASDCIG